MTKEKIKEAIRSMTVVELAELGRELEEEFGVTAAAPVAVAAAPSAGESGAEVAEKTEFTVTLKAFGDKKVPVIKVVRELTGLGLIEAKNLVTNAPATIKDGVSKEDAAQMKAKLEDVGATVVIE